MKKRKIITDTMRLNWMRKNMDNIGQDENGPFWVCHEFGPDDETKRYYSLRRAIDAAIRARRER